MQEDRDIVRDISDSLGFGRSGASDSLVPFKGHEVQLDGEWVPTSQETWRSWLGPRRLWGVEYHGDVYELGTGDGSPPWRGARVCPCDTCQRHVAPDNRYN